MTQANEETYGADYLRECASSWEPGARLLGNMPASAIVAVCDELAEAKAVLERVREAMKGCPVLDADGEGLSRQQIEDMGAALEGVQVALASHPETPDAEDDTEALIEQLDEALCTLLHNGDEVGTHAPREHLALFYARQAEALGLPLEDKQLLKRLPSYMAVLRSHERDLVAAKAKIAELESRITRQRAANSGLQRSYDAAAERAETAERDLRMAKTAFALVPPPSPEDSAVLAATDKVPESWLRSCVDASQVTRGLAPLAAAILDLRAAKRGGQ